MGESSAKGDRDGWRLSTCVRRPVQPAGQLWGDLAAASQYLCSVDEMEPSTHAAVQRWRMRNNRPFQTERRKVRTGETQTVLPMMTVRQQSRGLSCFQPWRFSRPKWTKPSATLSDLPTDLAFRKRLEWRPLKVPSKLNYLMIQPGRVQPQFNSFPQIIILLKMSGNTFYSLQLHSL